MKALLSVPAIVLGFNVVVSCVDGQQQCSISSCPWRYSTNQGYCDGLSTTEDLTRQTLYNAGIQIYDCPCSPNSSKECTEVGGLLVSTIQSLILFKVNYGSPVTVRAGSDPGHDSDNSTFPFTHENGYKVDIFDRDGTLNGLLPFISSAFDILSPANNPCQNNKGANYGLAIADQSVPIGEGGPCFTNEAGQTYGHIDIAFPSNSSTMLNVTNAGTGSGIVTSSSPSTIVIFCSSGTSIGCSATLTRAMNLTLTAQPAMNSVFDGWSGDIGSQNPVNPTLPIHILANTNVAAQFDPIPPPPPGNNGCWAWNAAVNGYVWSCPTPPPPRGGTQPSVGCWHWDSAVGQGAWVYDICPSKPSGSGFGLGIEIITSGDPNDKVGNPGVGSAQYLSNSVAMNYSIYFDNVPTATAPAQKVVVTDQLNPSLLDLSTLSLGPISFVDKLVTPPVVPLSVLGTYSTDVDLRPAKNLIARITASLNQPTGLLTWTYSSLDPATMLPTTDPLAGFLPPGTDGSASFNVIPKAASTGTQITNKATIVFDVNPSIDTPVWTNTIDSTKPMSKVSALQSVQLPTGFPVQWSGSDIGAGLQDFTVYVSDNGGPFTAWLTNTTASQGTYNGAPGHTYSFYSIARDLVGNVEGAKTAAEATTRVTTAIPLSSSQVSATASGLVFSRVTQTFNGTVTVKNIGTTAITGPFELVFTALPTGVSFSNSTGSISGLPYLALPGISTLSPGQSVTVNVQFANKGNAAINFTPVVYSGSLN